MNKHKENCFDIIRLFAALTVFYGHYFLLNNKEEPGLLHFLPYSRIAVIIFFAISGYLVTKSGLNSPDFIAFIKKRMARIFPALIICGLLIYGVLYPIIGDGQAYSKASLLATLRLISLQNGNTDPLNMAKDFIWHKDIDGSLWTLPLEFACYLILGIGLCFTKNIKSILIILIVFIIGTIFTLTPSTFPNFTYFTFYSIPMEHFFPRAVTFFTGSLMAFSEDLWNKKNTKIFVVLVGSIWFYSMARTPEINLIGFMIIPVIVIMIALSFKDKFIKGRFDYSYGIYIYSFPISQIMINYTTLKFWPSMIVSLILILIMASLSWHLVEKPVLNHQKTN